MTFFTDTIEGALYGCGIMFCVMTLVYCFVEGRSLK